MTGDIRNEIGVKDGASGGLKIPTSSGLCVRSKIWIELNGEPVLGQGRLELLRLVGGKGSINAAAKEMGIPYRKAWTYIDTMEKRLGFQLVLRSKGGTGGGESTLTAEAEALLEKFELLQKGFEELVNGKFAGLGFAA